MYDIPLLRTLFALLLLTACATPSAGPAAGDDPAGGEAPGTPARPPTGVAAREIRIEAGDLTLVLADQSAPTEALLQAVSPVSPSVVWASGHRGVWARTVDGGATWFASRGPAGDSLQFRDVEAFGQATAYLMSAGSGAASRIYRTDDGGVSWRLQYLADDPAAFLDCMAFWDVDTGVVYGDATDGRLFVLRTEDGGTTWSRVAEVPAAQEGEGGFAASGTCAVAREGGRGWIATGNAARARIATTADRGRSWTAVDAPVVGGASAGLATMDVRGGGGVAVGGVIGDNAARGRYVAVSGDGGRGWTEGGPLAMPGPVYGVAIAPGFGGRAVVAVGPGGVDFSADGGRSWTSADGRTHWAVAFAESGVGWATGPEGRVTLLRVERSRDR